MFKRILILMRGKSKQTLARVRDLIVIKNNVISVCVMRNVQRVFILTHSFCNS